MNMGKMNRLGGAERLLDPYIQETSGSKWLVFQISATVWQGWKWPRWRRIKKEECENGPNQSHQNNRNSQNHEKKMSSTPVPYDSLVKLVLVGDSAVGKSALLKRLAEDSFNDDYQNTVGVDFRLTGLTVGKKRVKLQVWDTAGQERYRTITSSYYRGAHGILLLFDLTARSTYNSLPSWLKEIKVHSISKDVPVLLLGTKVDCLNARGSLGRSRRRVSQDEALSFGSEHGIPYLELSSKTESSAVLNDRVMRPFVARILGSDHYSVLNRPRQDSIQVHACTPSSSPKPSKREQKKGKRATKKKLSWCC